MRSYTECMGSEALVLRTAKKKLINKKKKKKKKKKEKENGCHNAHL